VYLAASMFGVRAEDSTESMYSLQPERTVSMSFEHCLQRPQEALSLAKHPCYAIVWVPTLFYDNHRT
jgi:hypothetical protein